MHLSYYKPLPAGTWRARLRMDADALHSAAQRLRLMTLRQAPVPIEERHIAEMMAPHILASLSGGLDELADAVATVTNLARYVDTLGHHTPTLERLRRHLRDASSILHDLDTARRTETNTPEEL